MPANATPEGGNGLVGRVRSVLATCQAMALRELAARVQASEQAVSDAIGFLMEQGDVERLRPVFREGDDLDYYRLLRDSDRRYLRLRDLQRLMALAS